MNFRGEACKIILHGSTLLAALRLPLVTSVTGGPGIPSFGMQLRSGKHCGLRRLPSQPIGGTSLKPITQAHIFVTAVLGANIALFSVVVK